MYIFIYTYHQNSHFCRFLFLCTHIQCLYIFHFLYGHGNFAAVHLQIYKCIAPLKSMNSKTLDSPAKRKQQPTTCVKDQLVVWNPNPSGVVETDVHGNSSDLKSTKVYPYCEKWVLNWDWRKHLIIEARGDIFFFALGTVTIPSTSLQYAWMMYDVRKWWKGPGFCWNLFGGLLYFWWSWSSDSFLLLHIGDVFSDVFVGLI